MSRRHPVLDVALFAILAEIQSNGAKREPNPSPDATRTLGTSLLRTRYSEGWLKSDRQCRRYEPLDVGSLQKIEVERAELRCQACTLVTNA